MWCTCDIYIYSVVLCDACVMFFMCLLTISTHSSGMWVLWGQGFILFPMESPAPSTHSKKSFLNNKGPASDCMWIAGSQVTGQACRNTGHPFNGISCPGFSSSIWTAPFLFYLKVHIFKAKALWFFQFKEGVKRVFLDVKKKRLCLSCHWSREEREGGERLKTERGKILPSFLIVLGVVIR